MEEVTRIDIDDEELDAAKSIHVQKLLDVKIDVGTLLLLDTNDLNLGLIRSQKESYLKNLARDNCQLLFNEIWKLPVDMVDDVIVAKLPVPTTVLPREKAVPKPKPLTKWQQFVKDKGLKKNKKSNATWDDILQKWVPRYGYKKAAAEKEKNWVIEVPQNLDPMTDMFEKQMESKKEKVAKNEFQRLRNVAKAKNIKVPSMGLPPTDKLSSLQLNSAANIANVSTASLGKFQPRLSKEKTLSKKSILKNKKIKTVPLTGKDEHNKNMSIADSILNKKSKINISQDVDPKEVRRGGKSALKRKRTKSSEGNSISSSSKSKKPKGSGRQPSSGSQKRGSFHGKGKGGRKRR